MASLAALAKIHHRAGQAKRGLAVADRRSELHHCLVVISRTIRIDEGLGEGLEFFLGRGSILVLLINREDAGEHPYEITIADRFRFFQGDTGDRCRNVGANAR